MNRIARITRQCLTVIIVAIITSALLILLAGCMYNRSESYVFADNGSYVTADTGSQDKPVTAGASLGDAALIAGAALAGGGTGLAVAGPAGAVAGAGAAVIAQDALSKP